MKKQNKKKRVKRIVLFSFFALIWFFQFYSFGYAMTVPFRPGYTKIAERVYVYSGYGVQNEKILPMLGVAKERVNDFFGEIKSDPTIIFCDDKKEPSYNRAGTQTYMKSYIAISSELCNIDVIAHELTHAETHKRIIGFWDCFNIINQIGKVPLWFDEGVATQNDYREKYSEERWQKETNNGQTATALSDMNTPKKFYSGDEEERKFRYLCSKHEVAQWIGKHGKIALFELLDSMKQGKTFEELYF